MGDEPRSWSGNDKKWRRNCSNQVAAKSSFAWFHGVLQGLKPFFVLQRCVAVETATSKTRGRSFCDHRVPCEAGSQGQTDCGLATARRHRFHGPPAGGALCHLNPMRRGAGAKIGMDCGVATARRQECLRHSKAQRRVPLKGKTNNREPAGCTSVFRASPSPLRASQRYDGSRGRI